MTYFPLKILRRGNHYLSFGCCRKDNSIGHITHQHQLNILILERSKSRLLIGIHKQQSREIQEDPNAKCYNIGYKITVNKPFGTASSGIGATTLSFIHHFLLEKNRIIWGSTVYFTNTKSITIERGVLQNPRIIAKMRMKSLVVADKSMIV